LPLKLAGDSTRQRKESGWLTRNATMYLNSSATPLSPKDGGCLSQYYNITCLTSFQLFLILTLALTNPVNEQRGCRWWLCSVACRYPSFNPCNRPVGRNAPSWKITHVRVLMSLIRNASFLSFLGAMMWKPALRSTLSGARLHSPEHVVRYQLPVTPWLLIVVTTSLYITALYLH
jgi:hypothetical protein